MLSETVAADDTMSDLVDLEDLWADEEEEDDNVAEADDDSTNDTSTEERSSTLSRDDPDSSDLPSTSQSGPDQDDTRGMSDITSNPILCHQHLSPRIKLQSSPTL